MDHPHLPNPEGGKLGFRCIICERNYRPDDKTSCPGPRGLNAPDPGFAAKIKTIAIFPRGL